MARVFISFLGTNNYLTCNYEFPGKMKINGVKYVQEATLKTFCSDFTKEDRILIFLTQDARSKNWTDHGHQNKSDDYDKQEGLQTRILQMRLPASVHDIDIPEGFTEKQIWEIFDIIFESVHQNDKLIFDLTHAFRSIPMLGLVIVNYLNVVKKTDLEGIYYGAFEALDPISEVRNKKIEERNVQVLDLTPLVELQQWAIAAHSFINYGNSGDIINLSKEYTKRHKDLLDKRLDIAFRTFINSFRDLTSYFSTVRGNQIIEGKHFAKIREKIDIIAEKLTIKPLIPLLNEIKLKIEDYNENDILNGFRAVQWCIDHELIQQGVTLLEEMVVTYLCEYFSKNYNLNYKIKNDREFISTCLNVYNKDESEWRKIDKNLYEPIHNLHEQDIVKLLAEPYTKLPEIRNNINHGGFIGDYQPDCFYNKLKEYYQEIYKIISDRISYS